MKSYFFTEHELMEVRQLILSLSGRDSLVQESFAKDAGLSAHRLPERLKDFLHEFKNQEALSYCKIAGFRIDDAEIGNTPFSWHEEIPNSGILFAENFLVLVGSLLGEVFSFSHHIQKDRLVHNILPVKGFESSGLAFGSSDELLWHTEDAYYDYRADYLALLSLRNDEKTPTTIVPLEEVKLPEALKEILFQKRFYIVPDDTHQNRTSAAERRKVLSVLSGDKNVPFLCIDPGFTFGCDPEAQAALDFFCQLISEAKKDVTLLPGEICIIDNFRAVHGRKPFLPKYNGRDRWLKRIFISRDLRKSRSLRNSATSRYIHEVA